MRGPCRWVLFIALAAVLTGGCTPPSYHYLRDPSGTTIFKLPASWAVWDQVAIYRAEHPDVSYLTAQSATAGQWFVAFDSSPRPAVSDVLSAGSSHPTGIARARPVIDSQEQQQLSTAAGLRTALPGLDPQIVSDPRLFHVTSSRSLSLTGGYRGVDVVFQVRPAPSGPYDVFSQTIVVDPSISHLFVLIAGCSQSCYDSGSGGVIQTVTGSYTIKEH